MLEENRDLLNDITSKEDCKEGAAQIPKLIFDLVSQANKTIEIPNETEGAIGLESSSTSSADVETNTAKVSSAQEIIHNLPKVWRVLTELLNHQQLKPVELQVSLFLSFFFRKQHFFKLHFCFPNLLLKMFKFNFLSFPRKATKANTVTSPSKLQAGPKWC